MRAFYIFHIFTGIVLISMLVVTFKMRDSPAGRSGVVEVAPASGSDPAGLQPARAPREPLTFVDHQGEAVSELDFRGKHSLVFFGYTSCPDVCPMNLTVMASAMRELGGEAPRVQPLFITFDPERDTPEVLAKYVKHFHPSLLGLTGSREEIAAATRAYGVYYKVSFRDSEVPGKFDFEHSSQTYLIDPGGRAIALFEHDSDPAEMAEEIRNALAKSARGSEAEPKGVE